MNDKVISVRNIHKEFKLTCQQKRKMGLDNDKVIAVDNISFDIYKGEILCILGTNGAGKTTILQMLATLLKPNSGEIYYGDKNLSVNIVEIRKRIAFLTTELRLDDAFSASYLYDFFSSLYEVPKDIIVERKKKVFKMLGIDLFSEIKVGNLSTGMKQKVSIAISLVHNPDILIFDEPTNGLDILATRDIIDFLLKEKKRGKTLIVSTHIFELVDKIADRVIMIDNGRIIYEGEYADAQKDGGIEKKFFDQYDKGRM